MSGTYTTIQGDMWDSISYRLYGTHKRVSTLMQANSQHMDTFIFPAGVILTIPDVDTSSAASTLPPWKRVSG